MANPHAPVLLPLFAAVSTDDYTASYQRWSVVLLLVLGACAWIAFQLTRDWLASIAVLTFHPILISITQGNVTPFILLGLLLSVLLLRVKEDLWAGLALSVAVMKPQLALGLAIPLLAVRPKAFVGFCLGGSIFAAMGFMLVGVDGYRALIDTIIGMTRGEEPGTDPTKMFSVTGLLARAGLPTVLAWPLFIASIAGVSLLWRKRFNLQTHMIGIVLAVLALPHLFTHDLSLLAVPLLFVHPVAPIAATAWCLRLKVLGFPMQDRTL